MPQVKDRTDKLVRELAGQRIVVRPIKQVLSVQKLFSDNPFRRQTVKPPEKPPFQPYKPPEQLVTSARVTGLSPEYRMPDLYTIATIKQQRGIPLTSEELYELENPPEGLGKFVPPAIRQPFARGEKTLEKASEVSAPYIGGALLAYGAYQTAGALYNVAMDSLLKRQVVQYANKQNYPITKEQADGITNIIKQEMRAGFLSKEGVKEFFRRTPKGYEWSEGGAQKAEQQAQTAIQTYIPKVMPSFTLGGTAVPGQTKSLAEIMATGEMKLGRPAETIKTLATVSDTELLKATQIQASKVGLDVEAVKGIAPNEYWVSISANAKIGDEYLKWMGNVSKTNEDLRNLSKSLGDRLTTTSRGVLKPKKEGFLPFKNIEDAQRFLQTGDMSLVAKEIKLSGQTWTSEKLATSREAAQQDITRRTQGLEPIQQQITQLQTQIDALEPTIKAEQDIDKWTALRKQRDALETELQGLKSQYASATIKAKLPVSEVKPPSVEPSGVKPAVPPKVAPPEAIGLPETGKIIPTEGIPAAGVPPGGQPPAGIIPPPKPTPTPKQPKKKPSLAGMKESIERAKAVVPLQRPGIISDLAQKLPGIKQLREWAKPRLKMTGKNEKVVLGMLGEEDSRSYFTAKAFSTNLPIKDELKSAFGDGLIGQKTDVKFIGTEEQAKNPYTGTLLDIAGDPQLYDLTDAQKKAILNLNQRNDSLLNDLVDGWGAEVGKWVPKKGGAYLPLKEKEDDIIKILYDESIPVPKAKGKPRVYESLRERMKSDPTFKPELDITKLIDGLDTWKASAAGGQTYKAILGGKTRLEVLEEVKPELFKQMEALRTELRKMKGYEKILNKELREAIDDFLSSPFEDVDIVALKKALDVKLTPGRFVAKSRAGLSLADVKKIQRIVKSRISTLQPNLKSVNLKPYVYLEQGLYRYFTREQANLIIESRKGTANPLFQVLDQVRGGAFSVDLSPILGIQTPLRFYFDPVSAIVEFKGGVSKVIETKNLMRAFSRDALAEDIAKDLQNWSEFFALRGYAPTGTPKEFAAGWLSRFKGVTKFTEGTFIFSTRQMYFQWNQDWRTLVKGGMPEITAKAVAMDEITREIPLWRPTTQGLSPGRATLQRSIPTSISFIVKPAEQIALSASAALKFGSGQRTTARERLAFRRMLMLILTISTISAVSAAISAKVRKKDVAKAILDAVNPSYNNGNFWCLIVGDKRVPLGSSYRAYFRALAPQRIPGIPFPVPGAGLPMFYINRVGPALKAQYDLIKNRDFQGKPIMKGEFWEKLTRAIIYEASSAIPLTLSTPVRGLMREDDPLTIAEQTVTQFAGVNLSEVKDPPYIKLKTEQSKLGTIDEDAYNLAIKTFQDKLKELKRNQSLGLISKEDYVTQYTNEATRLQYTKKEDFMITTKVLGGVISDSTYFIPESEITVKEGYDKLVIFYYEYDKLKKEYYDTPEQLKKNFVNVHDELPSWFNFWGQWSSDLSSNEASELNDLIEEYGIPRNSVPVLIKKDQEPAGIFKTNPYRK